VSGRRFLLLRGGGGVWGVEGDAVRALHHDARGVTVSLRHGALLADEILGLDDRLRVRPPGALLRRLWPERCAGVALAGGVPVVIVAPEEPPRVLREREVPHDS
jgi:hypothetical protein